jgi:hypothetical protein
MAEHKTTINYSERTRAFTLKCGKAQAVVRVEGDEVANIKLSGRSDPRDWFMIGSRLTKLGGTCGEWFEALECDHAQSPAHKPCNVDWILVRGGVGVRIQDQNDEEISELRVTSSSACLLTVKSDCYFGVDQAAVAGHIINAVAIATARLVMFGAKNIATITETACNDYPDILEIEEGEGDD